MASQTGLNDSIRASQLRVVDADGKQLGVFSKAEALSLAVEQGLDLVEIAPKARPPVAKIVDWGKFNYQRTKQQQRNKQRSKAQEMKQMRFGLKIGQHDQEVKLNKVRSFLEAGNKVKISIFFRGRENIHKDLGFEMANRIINDLGDTVAVDQQPQLAGRQLNFVIRSNQGSQNAKTQDS